MRERRVAIDASRSSARAMTGTEWYSRELIDALSALDDRPQVTLYDRTPDAATPVQARITRKVVRPRRFWTHTGLSLAMVRDRPDALFVPAHVIPLIHPRCSIVTIHDLGYRHEPGAHSRRRRTALEVWTRWNARVARRVIAVSSQTACDLGSEYGTPARKIRVVHSAVNHQRFGPQTDLTPLADLGIGGRYVLFLSTVQPRKNIVRLVEAFEQLDEPDLQLVIAGQSGWLSEATEARISSSPHRNRIVRLGYVPDRAVPALYNAAQAFALPSLYEGFGMGVLEAMACGCPVVTSDLSSLPEVAGDAAILVDPTDVGAIRDGLARALRPDERSRLREAGFRRASLFTWERTARETMAVILEAMDAEN